MNILYPILHNLLSSFQMQFQILVIIYEILNCLAPRYLKHHLLQLKSNCIWGGKKPPPCDFAFPYWKREREYWFWVSTKHRSCFIVTQWINFPLELGSHFLVFQNLWRFSSSTGSVMSDRVPGLIVLMFMVL